MPGPQDARARRPVILHLSADFPDPIMPHKTPVIDRLIELVDDRYDHRVISINRRSPGAADLVRLLFGLSAPVPEASIKAFARGICLEYLAPAKGIFHATMLDRLADWIIRRLCAQDEIPDLVIGHKLTVEGLLAQAVASRLGIPYALTLQGNTDQKILSFRPDLKARFAAVYHGAACVFSFAPWARRAMEQRLGGRIGLTIDLPCPTVHETVRAPAPDGAAVISVFHLRNHRVKNLDGLAAAVRDLAASGEPCEVQIFGGGSPEETAHCDAIIRRAPGMRLMGPRSQDELGPIMNGAIAFVMPSRRESFGLVFIEALFAGLPIIYPKGASIDGYFDNLPFAISVDSHNPREIGAAIRYAITHERELKAALRDWQQEGGLERFTRTAIAQMFAHGLDMALASRGNAEQAKSITA